MKGLWEILEKLLPQNVGSMAKILFKYNEICTKDLQKVRQLIKSYVEKSNLDITCLYYTSYQIAKRCYHYGNY